MSPRLRAALVLVLTIGLLAYFVRGVDAGAVWSETRRANGWLIGLAILITLVTYVLRAFRWQYLLAPIGPTRFGTAFRTTVIGFAVSFLIPRSGEVLRPYLLARREQLPPTAAFATIILERLLDLITVLLLFGVFVLAVDPASLSGDPAMYARVKTGGLLAAAASIAGLAVFFALAGHPERLGRFAIRIERILPARLARAVASFVQTFAEGLAVMRQPGRLLVSLLLSFPLWLSIAAGIWATSLAFHMTFGYLGSFLVMTLLVVGVAMPTPGQVGGFHAAYRIAVVTFFGVAESSAVGGAIVLHAVSFVPVTILGLIFMAREGLSLGGMRDLAVRTEPPRSGGPSGVVTQARAGGNRREAAARARSEAGNVKGAPPSGGPRQ